MLTFWKREWFFFFDGGSMPRGDHAWHAERMTIAALALAAAHVWCGLWSIRASMRSCGQRPPFVPFLSGSAGRGGHTYAGALKHVKYYRSRPAWSRGGPMARVSQHVWRDWSAWPVTSSICPVWACGCVPSANQCTTSKTVVSGRRCGGRVQEHTSAAKKVADFRGRVQEQILASSAE
jgi:hypothetical protein